MRLNVAVGLSIEKLELLIFSSEKRFFILMIARALKSFSMKSELAEIFLGVIMCQGEDVRFFFRSKIYTPDLFFRAICVIFSKSDVLKSLACSTLGSHFWGAFKNVRKKGSKAY